MLSQAKSLSSQVEQESQKRNLILGDVKAQQLQINQLLAAEKHMNQVGERAQGGNVPRLGVNMNQEGVA